MDVTDADRRGRFLIEWTNREGRECWQRFTSLERAHKGAEWVRSLGARGVKISEDDDA